MPQRSLKMTAARAERLFHIAIDIADIPPSGDADYVDAPHVEPPVIVSQEEDAPLPLAAAPGDQVTLQPAPEPPTEPIAAAAPRPARRARTIKPPVAPVVVPTEPPTATRH
jgi:hypothetical protein